jgi:hypothetical protein
MQYFPVAGQAGRSWELEIGTEAPPIFREYLFRIFGIVSLHVYKVTLQKALIKLSISCDIAIDL